MDATQLTQREFWQNFAPQFHIADPAPFQNMPALQLNPAQQQGAAALLKQEGYLQARIDWGLDTKLMADTVRRLSEANLSPVFAFMYDEFWLPFFRLHFLISSLLSEKYYFLPDFWVWNVDPKRGESGWRPHRDKGHWSLFPDGSPKSLTAWIPLSSSTPLNGCMYVVPAKDDPTYGTADDKNWKFEYSSIRALPAMPGDFFIWNQAVLHWGSKTSPRAPESRVSMAFEFQRADVEPMNRPLLEPLQFLTFETRVKLISKQILQYKHMYSLDPQVEQFARKVLS